MTARFRFGRKGPVRFLGHLDMLRYFQRAVMKSGIPAKYSEGFHPHQLMSFAYPLAVSMETEGDYMDLDLCEERPEQEILEAINAVMHEGVWVSRVTLLPEGADNAMALVAAADYRIFTHYSEEALKRACEELLLSESLMIEKSKKNGKRKKETVQKDIRPGILKLEAEQDGAVFMKLVSGSGMNVRPTDILNMIDEKLGGAPQDSLIRRLEIYGENDGVYLPLSDCAGVHAVKAVAKAAAENDG